MGPALWDLHSLPLCLRVCVWTSSVGELLVWICRKQTSTQHSNARL
uniref:Uncharacterized protein n=1 Tax=Rhizophora mucronata TaxID=61149 RepID=A0A2P2NLW9_RHIMU